MRLPDGTGVELCRKLREMRPGVPIIYYSAYGDAADVERSLAICGDAYLKKPVCIADIEESVAKLLAAAETSDSSVERATAGAYRSTAFGATPAILLATAVVALPASAPVLLNPGYDPDAFPSQGATRSHPSARPFGLNPGHGDV